MFSVIRRKRQFWFCFDFENMPLPFSDFPFKSCLLFLKVWSTRCLQHQKYPRAGGLWPRSPAPDLRHPCLRWWDQGRLQFYSQAPWGLVRHTTFLKQLVRTSGAHPGLLLDGYLAKKWNELDVLKMVSPSLHSLCSNPQIILLKEFCEQFVPVLSKFLDPSRLNYIKIGSFRSFRGNSFWTVIHGVSEQAVQGSVEWTPRGSCFLTLLGRCCRQDRSRSNSSSFLGGKKRIPLFSLRVWKPLVTWFIFCWFVRIQKPHGFWWKILRRSLLLLEIWPFGYFSRLKAIFLNSKALA